jgi:uncharacterized membrane protein YbjE (DUF340 family)
MSIILVLLIGRYKMKNDEIANLKDSIEKTRRIMTLSEMLLSALAGKLEAAVAEAVEAVRQLETAVWESHLKLKNRPKLKYAITTINKE